MTVSSIYLYLILCRYHSVGYAYSTMIHLNSRMLDTQLLLKEYTIVIIGGKQWEHGRGKRVNPCAMKKYIT